MTFFRIITLVALTIFSHSLPAEADTETDAREIFAPWAPKSIEITNGGVLRITLNERRITDTVYYAVVQGGFCLGPLLNMEMPEVKSVFVLNSRQTQGWLFETGADACNQINNAPANSVKILIAGQSSAHTDTANGL